MRGKKILITIALILGIILVGACSSPTTAPKPPTTTAPAPPTTTVAPKPTTAAPSPTAAEVFPAKSIDLIVPYAAGGGTDRVARVLAGYIGQYLPVTLRVICMPGGGGTEGPVFVSKAKPDGYTLVLHTLGSVITPPMIRDVGYTQSNFVPIANLIGLSQALAIYPGNPLAAKIPSIDAVKDFVAYAKANPGKMTYGSSGTGGSAQFSMELFMIRAGIPGAIKNVPFDGSAESVTALMGGHIDVTMSSAASVIPQAQSGKLKVLCTAIKTKGLDAPTAKEAGIDWSFDVFTAIYGPKGMPADRVAYLEGVFKKTVEDKGFIDMATKVQGEAPKFMTGPDLQKTIDAQIPDLQKIADGIKLTMK